jgi:hypothetical protein
MTCMSFMKLTASMTVTMESIDAMSSSDSPCPSSVHWEIEGRVRRKEGESWEINGSGEE